MYATSGNIVGFGDAEADWELAIANLHNLALTIGEARKAGQTDAVNALMPQFNYWMGQARAAATALYGADMPSSVLMTLQGFADSVTGTVSSVLNTTWKVLLAAAGLGIVAWFYLKGRSGTTRTTTARES